MESNSQKINKLDLSAHVYSASHHTLPNDTVKKIENIKLKYKYQGDLYKLLLSLPSWVVSFKDIQRQNGRAKTKKSLLIKTIQAAEKLEEYIKYFSGEMRSNMRSERKKDKEQPFEYFLAIEKNLSYFIHKCQIESSKIPIDIGGKSNGSIPKSILWFLIQQYEYYVQREAKCGLSDIKDEYVGRFYEFIIEIKPILLILGIDLGKNGSIGTNIRRLLTTRNKERKKLTTLIIVMILNHEFLSLTCPNISYYWLYYSLHNLEHLKSPNFNF